MFPWKLFPLWVGIILSLQPWKVKVNAKEVEATREWTLLGENDTIPSGLHVRMNLETGGKWVKLLEEDDDENVDSKNNHDNRWKRAEGSQSLTTTTTTAPNNEEETKPRKRKGLKVTHLSEAEVQAAGTAKVTAAFNQKSSVVDEEKRKSNFASSVASLNDHVGSENEEENELDIVFDDGYNFKQMHGTFSKLPKEEQERMGGIPSLPDPEKVTLEEIQIFKDRMTSIWLQRQMELQKVQDELVVDLPKVIQERIIFIKEYLENPYQHLHELLAARSSKKQETEVDDEDEDDEDNTKINDILAVLLDLEYHMADIDMARDFHFMGGWPLLVSMISDSVHDTSIHKISNTSNNETGTTDFDIQNDAFQQELKSLVWEIQAAAAWTIGTAVKNAEEFYLWALEDFSNSIVNTVTEVGNINDDAPKHPISVISLLLSSSFLPPYTSIDDIVSPSYVKRQQKYLYALSALLRGNRLALRHFYMIDGPSILRTYLHNAIFVKNNGNNNPSQKPVLSNAGVKFASKVFALTRDLTTDITVHPDGGDNDSKTEISDIDEDIIESFTTPSWCKVALQLMQSTAEVTSLSIHENVLNSVYFMKPYCLFNSNLYDNYGLDISQLANLFIDSWNKDDFIDEDYKKDLTQLVEKILIK